MANRKNLIRTALCENCSNTEFFLVHIWTLFTQCEAWALDSFWYHHSDQLFKYITKYVYDSKRYMNENLIANANFRIWILNCRGGEVNFKKTTRCNSAKGGQVRKLVTWHWRIVMSEENRWLMLHFKKI